jgi:hypothetical protein
VAATAGGEYQSAPPQIWKPLHSIEETHQKIGLCANAAKVMLEFQVTSGPECRNWQTNRTQNPAHFTGRVGSSPTSGTTPPFATRDSLR